MSGRHRELLIQAFRAGVEAAGARRRLPSLLPITAPQGRTVVVGAGKAAAEMAAVADEHLPGYVEGLVLTRYGHNSDAPASRIEVLEGGHPLPDQRSFDGTQRILHLVNAASADDRVVFLMSGGGSALLSCPADGVTPRQKRDINAALIRSGASIAEINLVRAHLSKVKGGRLAAAALPAHLITYLISDVVGDSPALVASGPSVAGQHAPAQVRSRLQALGIPLSPTVDAALQAVRPVPAIDHPVHVIATATDALDAVEAFFRTRGWATERLGDQLEGDATDVGRRHAEAIRHRSGHRPPTALISGGELTVRVRNPRGRGGPNLEYLTALMLGLGRRPDIEALAGDSDGIDGSEDNAGGYLAPTMLELCPQHGLDPERMLHNNETYPLFEALGGLVVTGPTRTNVNDIRIILVQGTEPTPMVSQSDTPSESAPKNQLDARATDILIRNDRGGYTVPTDSLYPHQWNWDSAFVALGFATFDMDRAITELESLFEAQWRSGMVPHIAFRADDPRYFPGPSVWQTHRAPASSGITQPPVAASVAWSLWRQTTDEGHRRRLRALFPKTKAWHNWFRVERDPERRGVAVTIHPWESGRDNSPEWDSPAARVDTSNIEPYERRDLDHAEASMRPHQHDYDRYIALVQYGREAEWDQVRIARDGPFRVADVGINMVLLRADRDLAAWANALGETAAQQEIDSWVADRQKGVESLWDPNAEAFCSRDLRTGEASGFVTSASFLAFYAGAYSDAQASKLLEHWDRMASKVQFMIPSFDPDHSRFDAKRYWRGPCWAVVNYMVAQGLREAGYDDRAQRVHADTRAMIEQHGFFEAFSPLNGHGTGGRHFSWTAAMWLAWASASTGPR